MKSPGHTPSLVGGLLNALLMSTVFSLQIVGVEQGTVNKNSRRLPGWRTNTQKRIIALDEKLFTFTRQNSTFIDQQTKSTWTITGEAIAGPLKGKQLTPIPHGDYFAFAWLVFKPGTEIYSRPEKTN